MVCCNIAWYMCGGVVQVALDCGLNVIACVGESLEVREANKTLEASAHAYYSSSAKINITLIPTISSFVPQNRVSVYCY